MLRLPALRGFRLHYPFYNKAAGDQPVHDICQRPVPVNRGLHAAARSPGTEKWASLKVMVHFAVQLLSMIVLYPSPDRGHEAGMVHDVQVNPAGLQEPAELRECSMIIVHILDHIIGHCSIK